MKNSSSPTNRISCILPTFNRVVRREDGTLEAPLLEEAVMSFITQDYANCELLILNDTPGQPIEFEHPKVHVINFSRRFASLGEKCNFGNLHATGQYVTRWDDDDISLPRRLSAGMTLVSGLDLDALIVQGYFYLDQRVNEWQVLSGRFGFQQDIYRRHIALASPYANSSNGEDQQFRRDFLNHAKTKRHQVHLPSPRELTYIYRWGVSPMHLSIGLEAGEARYEQIGTRSICQLESPYVLQPHWKADYINLTNGLLQKPTDKPQATDENHDDLSTGAEDNNP